ncbi:MAG: hypothetical protein ACE5JA_02475 [bacterium]
MYRYRPRRNEVIHDKTDKEMEAPVCRIVKGNGKRRGPGILLREGKPSAVILDIEEYQEMLERLEDVEDLKRLEKTRKKPLKFKRLEDFLKECAPRV